MAARKGDGLAASDAGMASPVVVRDATPDADVSLLFTRFRRDRHAEDRALCGGRPYLRPAARGGTGADRDPTRPNIKPPPEHEPPGDSLRGRIATVQDDDVSTGDLAPDGVEVMAYRSNVPAIAEFTLRARDPDFRARIQDWGGGFIVGGENYGQGSSREHAALAPSSSA